MTAAQMILAKRCYDALLGKLPWLEALEVGYQDDVLHIRVMHCYPVDPSASVRGILSEVVINEPIELEITEVPQGLGAAISAAVRRAEEEKMQEPCDCDVCRVELN